MPAEDLNPVDYGPQAARWESRTFRPVRPYPPMSLPQPAGGREQTKVKLGASPATAAASGALPDAALGAGGA